MPGKRWYRVCCYLAAVFFPRRFVTAIHSKAAPIANTGSSEKALSSAQPWLVTSTPEASDDSASTAKTQKLRALRVVFFFWPVGGKRQRGAAGEQKIPAQAEQKEGD